MAIVTRVAQLVTALATLVFFVAGPSRPAAASDNTTRMYLEPVSGTVGNGQLIDVKVYVDVGDDDNLVLANGVVTYPAGLLQCDSVSGQGSSFEAVYNLIYDCDDNGPDDGKVGIYATASGVGVTGKRQLLGIIRFRGDAANDGTADLSLVFDGVHNGFYDSEAAKPANTPSGVEEVLDAVTGAQIRTK